VQFAIVILVGFGYLWWQRKNLAAYAKHLGCLRTIIYSTVGLLVFFCLGGMIAWIVDRW